MNKTKFKIGDKVKLKYPDDFDEFIDKWKEFWSENKTTIFIISFVTYNYYYRLQYTNGEKVMDVKNEFEIADFYSHEIKLHIDMFPDKLFEL